MSNPANAERSTAYYFITATTALFALTSLVLMSGKFDLAHLFATGEVRADTGAPDPNDCDFVRTEINILDNEIAKTEAYLMKHPYDQAAQKYLSDLIQNRTRLTENCGHTSAHGDH